MTSNLPRPSVTVIALCYNHERFLIECLESIRAQSFQDFELIVTDDYSRDASANLIQDWLEQNYPDAQFIRHQKNIGLCATLNEALRRSRGEFISMISTDDVWESDKIERQMTMVHSQPEHVAVVYSDAMQIDETGVRLPTDFIEFHRPGLRVPTGKVFATLADGNFIPAMATLIRREAIEAVGRYDERLVFEDYDMWLRLAHRYDFVFCKGLLARYRLVASSLNRALTVKPTADFHYTMFLMREKWLPSGSLSAAQEAVWAGRQLKAAYALYRQGDPRAFACLRIATLRILARPRVLLLGLGASWRLVKRLHSLSKNMG